MLRPLQQLIDALRLELQQYGELLALLDEQPHVLRHSALPPNGWDLEPLTDAIMLARQSRERWQHQLAWAAGRPEASAFDQLIPLIPKPYHPLIIALVAENESLFRRVGSRMEEHFQRLDRTREISQQTMACLVSPHPAEDSVSLTRPQP